MSRYFFIFALPRSRTAWLANWLTTDKSFCWHEIGATVGESAWDTLQATPVQRVGCSEPSPELLKVLPPNLLSNSPAVVVLQPLQQAFMRCITAWPSIYDTHHKRGLLLALLQAWNTKLKQIGNQANCVTVQENMLSDCDILEKLWRHLLSGLPFNALRTSMLLDLDVKVIYQDMEQGGRVIERRNKIAEDMRKRGGVRS